MGQSCSGRLNNPDNSMTVLKAVLNALKFLLTILSILQGHRAEAPHYPSTEATFEFFISFIIQHKESLVARMNYSLSVLPKLQGPVLDRKIYMILAWLIRHESKSRCSLIWKIWLAHSRCFSSTSTL